MTQTSKCKKKVYSWGEGGAPAASVNRKQRRLQEKHRIVLLCSRETDHEGDCMPLGEIYRRLALGEKIKGWELTAPAVLVERGGILGLYELIMTAPMRFWRWLTQKRVR